MKKKMFLKVMEYYNILSLILFSWSDLGNKKIWLLLYTLIMILVLIFVILAYKINIISKLKNSKIPLLICTMLLFSSIYSINVNKSISSSMMIFISTLYSILLYIIYDNKSFYSLLSKYFIISIITSIIYIIFIPSIGLTNYYGQLLPEGVYSHKNVLARNMIISCIIFFNIASDRNGIKKIIYILWGIIACVLLFLSKSVTGIIYLISFMIITFLLIKRESIPQIYIKLIYIIIIIFNILCYLISNPRIGNILSKIYLFGKNLTFTGRNVIWEYAFEMIAQKPFLGYGFDVFWQSSFVTEIFYKKNYFIPPHAHNGYLGILLDGGIVLLILIMHIIYKTIQRISNKYNDTNDRISILILLFILLVNLTESAFISNGNYLFWIIICFNFAKYKELNILNEEIKNKY